MSDYEEIMQMDNGLKFYKTDLHIHYPIDIKNETECFEDGTSIERLVDKLIELDYDLVSIGNHNSIKAIQEIKENNFDLINTDLKMPKQEGLSIVKHAKDKDSEMPVIIITGISG